MVVCGLTCEPPPSVFIELVINTVIWSHYNRYINVVVPYVRFVIVDALADIRVPLGRWSGALPSILGSRLFLRMREAILFPERYGTDLYAITSGMDAQSTVRFTGTSRPVPTWTPQTRSGGGTREPQSWTQGTSTV